MRVPLGTRPICLFKRLLDKSDKPLSSQELTDSGLSDFTACLLFYLQENSALAETVQKWSDLPVAVKQAEVRMVTETHE